MKSTSVKDKVARGLANILLSLSIRNPSGKTKNYLKKVTKKLTKRLKTEAKKAAKKTKKGKSLQVVRTKTKAVSRKPISRPRKKK